MGLKVQNLQPNSELTRAREALETCLQAGSDQFESKLVHADKTIIDVEISSSLFDPTQGIIQGIVKDIRTRKRLETRLLQAQKLEALGTLAGKPPEH